MKNKGYAMSNNYSLLWELTKNGYRVPAYVFDRDRRDFDAVDIRETATGSVSIRGIGYDTGAITKTAFEKVCKAFAVWYVMPREGALIGGVFDVTYKLGETSPLPMIGK